MDEIEKLRLLCKILTLENEYMKQNIKKTIGREKKMYIIIKKIRNVIRRFLK